MCGREVDLLPVTVLGLDLMQVEESRVGIYSEASVYSTIIPYIPMLLDTIKSPNKYTLTVLFV